MPNRCSGTSGGVDYEPPSIGGGDPPHHNLERCHSRFPPSVSSTVRQKCPIGARGNDCPWPIVTRMPFGCPKMLICSYRPAAGAGSPGECSDRLNICRSPSQVRTTKAGVGAQIDNPLLLDRTAPDQIRVTL